jgi:hypothetical protein
MQWVDICQKCILILIHIIYNCLGNWGKILMKCIFNVIFIQFNSVFIIYVPSQQLQGQLQTQHIIS